MIVVAVAHYADFIRRCKPPHGAILGVSVVIAGCEAVRTSDRHPHGRRPDETWAPCRRHRARSRSGVPEFRSSTRIRGCSRISNSATLIHGAFFSNINWPERWQDNLSRNGHSNSACSGSTTLISTSRLIEPSSSPVVWVKCPHTGATKCELLDTETSPQGRVRLGRNTGGSGVVQPLRYGISRRIVR